MFDVNDLNADENIFIGTSTPPYARQSSSHAAVSRFNRVLMEEVDVVGKIAGVSYP